MMKFFQPSPKQINLHGWASQSRSVGPGARFSIYTQGCPIGCPGCFNPETHPMKPNKVFEVKAFAEKILKDKSNLEGVTIGGGEPLIQIEALNELIKLIRRKSGLSIILYSGYTLEQITKMPLGKPILDQIDVLIDGVFVQRLAIANDLRGSSNQKIHLLTEKYSPDDLVPESTLSFQIDPDGNVSMTGFPEENWGLPNLPHSDGRKMD